MAVKVERQQRYCPDCNELLSYTSADAKIRERSYPSIYHENGRNIPMINTEVEWYITCPTCKKTFNVARFTRYKNKK